MTQTGPNDPRAGDQGAAPPPRAGPYRQAPDGGYGQPNWQQGQPYGQQGWQQPYGQPYQVRPTNGMAIAAIIVTFVFAPVGLVLGIMARNQIRRTGEDGEGLATAAIIVSSVFLAIWVLMLVVFVGLFASVASNIHGVSGVTGTTFPIHGVTP